MTDRAFPVVFATRVVATVAFYEQVGFRRFFQLPAADMPWGERVAYVADPDDNPVALAAPASPTSQ